MKRILHAATRLPLAIGGMFFASALLVTGCGGPPAEAKNSVSGKVTVDGQPVAGMVSFIYDGKKEEKSTPINPKGEYIFNDPEPGTVKVVVKGMLSGQKLVAPPDGKTEGAGLPGAGGAAPPAKYESVATTPLTYEIKTGKQKFDIQLTP